MAEQKYVPARKLHGEQDKILATVEAVLAELKTDEKLKTGISSLEANKEAIGMMISAALATRNPRTKEGFETRAEKVTADWLYLAAAYAVVAADPTKAVDALGLTVEAYIRANS